MTLESRLPREERRGEDLSRELRLLTGEVRGASQHADALAAEVERETRAAGERMRSLRSRVAPRLEPPVETPAAIAPAAAGAETPAAASASSEHAARLLERVREMIQDATQKGERLSAVGERASRTADRLLRRLEDEAREIEGLMVRLSPAGELAAEDQARNDAGESAISAADLRLLDDDDNASSTGVPAPGETPFPLADTASDYADELRRPGRGAREDRP